jgi:O-antigen/teichoic acid export membrane protein
VVAVAAGSALMGVVRGTLSARRRFDAVGASLAAENGLRCVAAAALVLLDVDDPVAYGGCLVAGYLAAALWPSSLRLGREGSPPAPGSPLALVSGVGAGQLLAQLVLTGGPVLLAVAGGAPAEVTGLFAALALFRAPYMLAVGLVAPLTSRLTALVVLGRDRELGRFRTGVVVATVAAASVATALGGWVGPGLMTLVFGEGVRLDGRLTALLALGTVLAMANLVLTLMLVARGRSGGLLRGWLAGGVPGVVLFAWSGQPVVERTCWTFLVVEATVFGWLLVEDVVAGRRAPGQRPDGREDG